MGKKNSVLAKVGRLGQKLKTFGYNFQIENQNPNLTGVRNCERNEVILKDHNFFITVLFLMIFDVLDAFKRKLHFLFGH